jgi:hypothetical protein
MSGPITNFELGKMQHREYEAQASKYWGQNVTQDDKPNLLKRLILAKMKLDALFEKPKNMFRSIQ